MEEIKKAVQYLKSVSLTEVIEIRVEEIEFGRIVLSFREKNLYVCSDRIIKEFIFENGEVIKMQNWVAPTKGNDL